MLTETRLDKYLWAIRMYKSRSVATEAIEGGKVKYNGQSQKPSKKVKVGEIYTLKREHINTELEVVKIIEKRVSAPLAQECYREIITELTDAQKLASVFFAPNTYREKGKGRPTKRERREIDDHNEEEI
jgi:ribosome-associated heat shock protein Hsp15